MFFMSRMVIARLANKNECENFSRHCDSGSIWLIFQTFAGKFNSGVNG